MQNHSSRYQSFSNNCLPNDRLDIIDHEVAYISHFSFKTVQVNFDDYIEHVYNVLSFPDSTSV